MLWSPIPKSSAAAEPRLSDREWFVPLTFIVLSEVLLWYAAYLAGDANHPVVVTYGSVAVTFFTLAICWKATLLLYREKPASPVRRLIEAAVENRERIILAALGSLLLAMGSAAFGSLKAGIPRVVPFWFDLPLARFEDGLFGGPPALLIDRHITWALPFVDRLYATFVGTHLLAVLAVLASKPSLEKSRALVSLALAWLLMGIFGAYCCSSVGPIFFDRVYGGHEFAELTALLGDHAPFTVFTADALWALHQDGTTVIGNGISAFPSMHVTLTCWLALVLSRTRFAPLGWSYLAFIWAGSILLGWHWGLGGIAGDLGMLGLWKLAPKLLFVQPGAGAERIAMPIPVTLSGGIAGYRENRPTFGNSKPPPDALGA